MKTLLFYPCLLAIAFLCTAQQSAFDAAHESNFFVIDGLQVEWEFDETELTFQLHSPYKGWVGLGFNTTNDIVNSHLVMGAVDENGVNMEEFFVANFADSRPIKNLGGAAAVTFFKGDENSTGTNFEFTLDTTLEDEYRHKLAEGQKVWLICSYSMEDDFGHHSIMRRHVEITL